MDKKNISFTLGARLKELRQERGLSHDRLREQLKDQYGISVSRDSLMAYEVADETRSKADKLPNLGMRVEYLYCLADFYEVSLDYLLGLSHESTINGDLAQACRYTGLPASSVDKLHELSTSSYPHPKALLQVINAILNYRVDDFITWVWRGAMASCCPEVNVEDAELGAIRHGADIQLVEAVNTGEAKTVELPISEYKEICMSTAVGITRDATEIALQEFNAAFIKEFKTQKGEQ